MEGGLSEQPGQFHGSPNDQQRGVAPAVPGVAAAGAVPQTGGSVSTPPTPYRPRSPGQQNPAGVKPIRRRMRMITSCLECRRRKLGCSKTNPCENCVKFSRECVFLSSKLDEASQLRLNEIKEKVGSLERSLERDVAKFGPSKGAGRQRFVVDEAEYETFEDLDPWPSDAVCTDVAYDDDNAEGAEDLLDVGVKIGRMRMTDRVGGLSRPRLSEEMMVAIHGVSDPACESPEMSTGGTPARELAQPGSTYIQPSSDLIFGGHAHSPTSLDMILPAKAISDGLIERYLQAVHPVTMCVHQPSFREEYQIFWDEVYANVEPRPSTQALILAAMFSAAVSLDGEVAMQRFGYDHNTLVNNLKTSVESALCQASFLRTTKVETLQALIIYLIPFCRAELPRTATVLVGAAIRLAECIGLHRDGEKFGFNPVDTHVRRLLWHQLCILDIRAAEAHGPRPSIRREDYDTKLPPNCEEDAIRPDGGPPEPQDRWTPMIFSLIRFEINEIMRVIWLDRRKLERRQMLLTEVLSKTEDFRKRMIGKYEAMLQDKDPYQRYAKLVMHLLLYKLYAMVLHPYHQSSNLELPQRLNNVVIMAGIMMIEIAIRLENDTLFRDWAWYFGAYSQHQLALLLAVEIQVRPANRDAARMWPCIDYVFDLDRNLPAAIKLKRILEEVWRKTAVYRGLRKLRTGPPGSEQPVQGTGSVGPGRRSGKSPEHQRQPPHLSPYHQSSGPSATHQGRTNPAILMGQYGVGGTGSTAAQPLMQPGMEQGGQTSTWMEDIDWETVNAIFPADPATGEVNLSGYHDPSISIYSQQWQDWR